MIWVLHEGQLVSCQTLHATDAPIGMHRTLLFRCQHVLENAYYMSGSVPACYTFGCNLKGSSSLQACTMHLVNSAM